MKALIGLIFLVGVVMIQGVVSYRVLAESRGPYVCDEFNRIETGIRCSAVLFGPGVHSLQHKMACLTVLDKGQGHPHFAELIEALVWRGMSIWHIQDLELMMVLFNSGFLLLLLYSVFRIGQIMSGTWGALIAVFLTAASPLVFGHARMVMLDFPMTCMLTFSFYLLLRTKNFYSVGYSLFFGLAAGLAQLTKEAAVLFLAGPFMYTVLCGCLGPARSKARWNVVLAAGAFLVVAGAVYLSSTNTHAIGTYMGKIAIQSGNSFRYYFAEFPHLIGSPVLCLVLPLLFFYIAHIRSRSIVLLLWLVVPLVIFSLSPNKAVRFMMPVVPAVALMAAYELSSLKLGSVVRKIVLVLVLGLAGMQYMLYNNGYYSSADWEKGRWQAKKNLYDLPADRLLEVFKQESLGASGRRNVVPLFNLPEITDTLLLKFIFNDLDFIISCPGILDDVDVKKSSWKGAPEEILFGDYVLQREKIPLAETERPFNHVGQGMREGFKQYKGLYVAITRVPLADGSEVVVYKRSGR